MKKLISTALVSIIIFNQVMAMDILNKKEENIVRVAAFAAAGDQQKLKAALADGLDSGVSVNEFKEIFVQTYAYCGFPRSLNALGTFMNLLKERGGKDEIDKEPSALPSGSSLDFGAKNQTKLVGREVKGELFDFAPAIDQYLKAHLFGDIGQIKKFPHRLPQKVLAKSGRFYDKQNQGNLCSVRYYRTGSHP